jgi:DNA-binding NtrC family response regulator
MSAHVLLIEDDDQLRAAIVRYLLDEGHRVTVCGSVAEAVEALEWLPPAIAPDAIMSDVFLADGDGVSFFLNTSRRFPAMRWIVTATSHELEESMVEGARDESWMSVRRDRGAPAGDRATGQ